MEGTLQLECHLLIDIFPIPHTIGIQKIRKAVVRPTLVYVLGSAIDTLSRKKQGEKGGIYLCVSSMIMTNR